MRPSLLYFLRAILVPALCFSAAVAQNPLSSPSPADAQLSIRQALQSPPPQSEPIRIAIDHLYSRPAHKDQYFDYLHNSYADRNVSPSTQDASYFPCHGCSPGRKIMNALLAEVNARHEFYGRPVFGPTPAISLPGYHIYRSRDPLGVVIISGSAAATRVGQHLFTEFVSERRHDRMVEDELTQ